MRVVALTLIMLLFGIVPADAGTPWRITKDHWSQEDEDGFGKFVTAIGASNCSSTQSCLRDKANPWRDSDGDFVDIDVDCAKWPYLLRGYYAWKNHLPMGYVDAVNGAAGDLRYNKTSNRATSRTAILDHGSGIDAPRALRNMFDAVFSGTYRTDAAERKGVLSDFYSPALQPGSIHPGSVVYDVNGHVGLVWKVDEDGRIYYMDAHPDYTVTRSVYGAQFGQSPMRLGGGLKNWRPFLLVGAKHQGANLIGGRLVYTENDQITDFSLVQYLGTEPNPKQDVTKARFVYNGAELGFYEYVRVAVSGGRMDFNPVYELQATIKTLCNDLNDRAQYVDNDIKDGIADKPHPNRLPDNIYGSENLEWETYSTPSRDARIKAAFIQFYKDLSDMLAMYTNRDPRIVYDGLFLQQDLARAYDQQSRACTLTYINSAHQPVNVTFDDIVHRLYQMSFDPYHCVELRWGASGAERDTCEDDRKKLRWYDAEQRLRNSPDRTYDINMAFDLDDLNRHVKGSGTDVQAPIDIKSLIDAMPPRVAFTPMKPGDR